MRGRGKKVQGAGPQAGRQQKGARGVHGCSAQVQACRRSKCESLCAGRSRCLTHAGRALLWGLEVSFSMQCVGARREDGCSEARGVIRACALVSCVHVLCTRVRVHMHKLVAINWGRVGSPVRAEGARSS